MSETAPDPVIGTVAWALDYARRYWQHGNEPESQAALTVLAHVMVDLQERLAALCHCPPASIISDGPSADCPVHGEGAP